MDRKSYAASGSARHWENYWGGAGDHGDGREAAVTGTARSAEFQEAWRVFFQEIDARRETLPHLMHIMDLACGAGVLTDLAMSVLTPEQMSQICFIGVDYSISASRQYSAKFAPSGASSAVGVVGDVLHLPFKSGSVDVVASQFGLEYAGATAVAGASRLLALNGKIMCLTHYRSGAIERECSENLRIADAIISSDVLAKARLLFTNPGNPQASQQLNRALQVLRELAEESPASAGHGLLMRLRADLTRLAVRRAAFEPREAISWLDANKVEISMYRDRMRSMTSAALDKAQIAEIIERWKADGLEVDEPVAISMDRAPAPSGWQIGAHRP